MAGAVEVEPIQYEVDGHVARIWLNRPHKRNSVSQQLLQELDEAVQAGRGRRRRPRDRVPGPRGDVLLGIRSRRAPERLHRADECARDRAALGAHPRLDLQLAQGVGLRARGPHDRRRVRDHDQLRLRGRLRGRADRRLPHAPRAVRRGGADLPAPEDPRRAQGQGADALRQAAHRHRGEGVGPRQRLRSRRRARRVRRPLRRPVLRQEPVPDGDHEDDAEQEPRLRHRDVDGDGAARSRRHAQLERRSRGCGRVPREARAGLDGT